MDSDRKASTINTKGSGHCKGAFGFVSVTYFV